MVPASVVVGARDFEQDEGWDRQLLQNSGWCRRLRALPVSGAAWRGRTRRCGVAVDDDGGALERAMATASNGPAARAPTTSQRRSAVLYRFCLGRAGSGLLLGLVGGGHPEGPVVRGSSSMSSGNRASRSATASRSSAVRAARCQKRANHCLAYTRAAGVWNAPRSKSAALTQTARSTVFCQENRPPPLPVKP
jgi:hypothetical protein